MITFQENANLNDVVAINSNTTLTAFFLKNMEDTNARKYTYLEFVHFYIWNTAEKKWMTRKRGGEKIIARISRAMFFTLGFYAYYKKSKKFM